MLTRGQKYDMHLEIVVPLTRNNQHIGMFMSKMDVIARDNSILTSVSRSTMLSTQIKIEEPSTPQSTPVSHSQSPVPTSVSRDQKALSPSALLKPNNIKTEIKPNIKTEIKVEPNIKQEPTSSPMNVDDIKTEIKKESGSPAPPTSVSLTISVTCTSSSISTSSSSTTVTSVKSESVASPAPTVTPKTEDDDKKGKG